MLPHSKMVHGANPLGARGVEFVLSFPAERLMSVDPSTKQGSEIEVPECKIFNPIESRRSYVKQLGDSGSQTGKEQGKKLQKQRTSWSYTRGKQEVT